MVWTNDIIQGILLGGLYALFAAGLSLVFGVMRLVNLAHGDFSIMAAYIALVLVGSLNINPFYTLILVMIVMAVFGYLIQRGLAVLREGRRPGLAALAGAAGIELSHISARHLAYRLGPRLNAAGRLAHARQGVELLLTEDPAEAREMAYALEALNSERQAVADATQQAVLALSAFSIWARRLSVEADWPGVARPLASIFSRSFSSASSPWISSPRARMAASVRFWRMPSTLP